MTVMMMIMIMTVVTTKTDGESLEESTVGCCRACETTSQISQFRILTLPTTSFTRHVKHLMYNDSRSMEGCEAKCIDKEERHHNDYD